MPDSVRLDKLYDAASRTGLLMAAVFAGVVVRVDFRALDEDVLEGLIVSRRSGSRGSASMSAAARSAETC